MADYVITDASTASDGDVSECAYEMPCAEQAKPKYHAVHQAMHAKLKSAEDALFDMGFLPMPHARADFKQAVGRILRTTAGQSTPLVCYYDPRAPFRAVPRDDPNLQKIAAAELAAVDAVQAESKGAIERREAPQRRGWRMTLTLQAVVPPGRARATAPEISGFGPAIDGRQRSTARRRTAMCPLRSHSTAATTFHRKETISVQAVLFWSARRRSLHIDAARRSLKHAYSYTKSVYSKIKELYSNSKSVYSNIKELYSNSKERQRALFEQQRAGDQPSLRATRSCSKRLRSSQDAAASSCSRVNPLRVSSDASSNAWRRSSARSCAASQASRDIAGSGTAKGVNRSCDPNAGSPVTTVVDKVDALPSFAAPSFSAGGVGAVVEGSARDMLFVRVPKEYAKEYAKAFR